MLDTNELIETIIRLGPNNVSASAGGVMSGPRCFRERAAVAAYFGKMEEQMDWLNIADYYDTNHTSLSSFLSAIILATDPEIQKKLQERDQHDD